MNRPFAISQRRMLGSLSHIPVWFLWQVNIRPYLNVNCNIRLHSYYIAMYTIHGRMRWLIWLTRCATNRKVDGVAWIFNGHNPSWNLGASTSRNPQGLFRPVMGLIYYTSTWFGVSHTIFKNTLRQMVLSRHMQILPEDGVRYTEKCWWSVV
jgi:hypothetical protein